MIRSSVKFDFNQSLYLVTALCKSFDRAVNLRLHLTFIGPCIVSITPIVKPTRYTNLPNLFYFGNDTLHISDGLSVHHQEFKTVHKPVTPRTVLN